MGKIVDNILARQKKIRNECSSLRTDKNPKPGFFYSFEFFPPKTEAGLENLMGRIDRMVQSLDPIFIDVTWGAGGSTSTKSMAVASHAQQYSGVDVLLHLTCTGMSRARLKEVLDQAKANGIRNVLALRGDPPRGKRAWEPNDVSGGDMNRAIDLVKFTRQEFGDYFCIAIAGHPEGHPSSTSMEQEMAHLKDKVDAGADFILTQFFYSSSAFLGYVRRCRQVGISCPIIPGIMPIQSFSSFTRMTDFCGISVPPEIMSRLEAVRHDDESVKAIGCEIAAEMCREILKAPADEGGVDGIHFYTLNLERSVTRILVEMGAVDLIHGKNEDIIRTAIGRAYPWKQSALENRAKEEVRPINWANLPRSYVKRTADWDEFPNGRWGDSTSPAFGELSDLSHFYSFTLGSEEERKRILGSAPETPEDVFEVFARYVEGRVPQIPWCETPLQPESFLIQPQLAKLNRSGFLTINSQPSVNCAPSSDATFGWGGPGGYVYQKAYCECFADAERTQQLVSLVGTKPSLKLYAVNNAGEEIHGGSGSPGVTALTWGVFPNREILQPTVFDPSTFLVWAEEAFSLWTSMWSSLYDIDSDSFDLVETIRDTFYLVAIVDNDFTNPDGSQLWNVMFEAASVK